MPGLKQKRASSASEAFSTARENSAYVRRPPSHKHRHTLLTGKHPEHGVQAQDQDRFAFRGAITPQPLLFAFALPPHSKRLPSSCKTLADLTNTEVRHADPCSILLRMYPFFFRLSFSCETRVPLPFSVPKEGSKEIGEKCPSARTPPCMHLLTRPTVDPLVT